MLYEVITIGSGVGFDLGFEFIGRQAKLIKIVPVQLNFNCISGRPPFQRKKRQAINSG